MNAHAKASDMHSRKLLRNEIRELERKILEVDSKTEEMEDELKLQQVIMSKVVFQLPGASYFKRPGAEKRNMEEEEAFLDQLEKVVGDFETYRAS